MPDQPGFRAALLDASLPVPAGLLDGHGSTAGRRYGVYRNNVAVSLTEALREGFPVLRKLLGDQNFDALAGLFLRAHPPTSPLMMHYGDAMPSFLTSFAPLQHIGYLPDVARLELAFRQSYHAADSTPVDPQRLTTLGPDALTKLRLTLAPSLRLIRSDWPLFDIWRFNTEAGAPKPAAVAQSVLITRAAFDPEPFPLTSPAAEALETLRRGQTIAHALAAGEAADPDFDISPLLGRLISQNTITDATL